MTSVSSLCKMENCSIDIQTKYNQDGLMGVMLQNSAAASPEWSRQTGRLHWRPAPAQKGRGLHILGRASIILGPLSRRRGGSHGKRRQGRRPDYESERTTMERTRYYNSAMIPAMLGNRDPRKRERIFDEKMGKKFWSSTGYLWQELGGEKTVQREPLVCRH
jgi:hypothetical protein